ncbi:MAG TPA: hypothetical protein VEX64_05855 [Pyrinomonadaceae bacterium]|nr:hypothetical protein [Pyrinomonadaceae bacterium]
MKKHLFLIAVFTVSLAALSCDNAATRQNSSGNSNTAVVVKDDNSPLLATSHSSRTAPSPPASAGNSNLPVPVMTGNQQAIDTTELDSAIAAAEKNLKQKPKDEAAKKAMAEAYLQRALALTEAAQYKAALGDYRRVLKNDPENPEAKKWIDQIVGIFKSMKREVPAEGQEPPPLPFKKASTN